MGFITFKQSMIGLSPEKIKKIKKTSRKQLPTPRTRPDADLFFGSTPPAMGSQGRRVVIPCPMPAGPRPGDSEMLAS